MAGTICPFEHAVTVDEYTADVYRHLTLSERTSTCSSHQRQQRYTYPSCISFDHHHSSAVDHDVSHDHDSLHVVPQLAMLASDAVPADSAPVAALDRITSSPSVRSLANNVTCCAWWRRHDGQNIAILGTKVSAAPLA